MRLEETTNISLNDVIELSEMLHDIPYFGGYTPEYLVMLMLNKQVTLLKGYINDELIGFLLLGGSHIYAIHAREQMDNFRELGLKYFKDKGLTRLTWFSKLPERIIAGLIPNINKIYTAYEVKL